MRLGYRLFTTLAVVSVCCCLAMGRQELRNPDAAWQSDYDKALGEARKAGKPLMVVFACLH